MDSLDECPDTVGGIIVVDDVGCIVSDNNGGTDNGGTDNGGTDDNSGSGTEDAGEKSGDSTESGTNVAMIGGIGFGVVIIVILTLLILRKGREGENLAGDAYANAAFDQHMGGMEGADAGISPEQLQYEQQLLAAGYTPEQARAYADQYFRPHMVQ